MKTLIAILLIAALALPCGAPPAIVAFGDSITVGYGAHSRAGMWADRLEGDVGTIENAAVAGSTVAQQRQIIEAYTGEATTALWLSCTNDLFAQTPAAQYRATLKAGVLHLRQRGMRVYLGTCLGLKGQPALDALHTSYSDAARAVAVETGAILVDVDSAYDPLTMEAAFLPHHPNDAGHAVIAQTFLTAWRWQVFMPGTHTAAYPAP